MGRGRTTMSTVGRRLAALSVLVLGLVVASCGGARRQADYRCPMHPEVVAQRPGDCPVCGMKLVAADTTRTRAADEHPEHEAKAELYVCPMDPQVSSPTPGKCPICGMNLVKREAAAPSAPAAAAPTGLAPVSVPAVKRELLGMTTGEVVKRHVFRRITAATRIAADESRLYRVTTPADGWVDTLFVAGVGDSVRRGAPLAELYNVDALNALRRDLYTIGHTSTPGTGLDPESLLRLRTDPTYQPYELVLARIRRWGLSEQQIKEWSQKPAEVKDLVVYAPAGGIVAEKSVIPGQKLIAGDQLLVLADLSRVWAEADLAAADGSLVKTGLDAKVTVPALPGRSFAGRLAAFAPFLDPQTRTQRVRIELANPDLVLRPGLPAVADIDVDLGERLAVPASAVLRTGERAYAFRVEEGDRIAPVAVRLGVAEGEWVEILDGLVAGDRVVTSATFLIDSESAMAAALRAVSER